MDKGEARTRVTAEYVKVNGEVRTRASPGQGRVEDMSDDAVKGEVRMRMRRGQRSGKD